MRSANGAHAKPSAMGKGASSSSSSASSSSASRHHQPHQHGMKAASSSTPAIAIKKGPSTSAGKKRRSSSSTTSGGPSYSAIAKSPSSSTSSPSAAITRRAAKGGQTSGARKDRGSHHAVADSPSGADTQGEDVRAWLRGKLEWTFGLDARVYGNYMEASLQQDDDAGERASALRDILLAAAPGHVRNSLRRSKKKKE